VAQSKFYTLETGGQELALEAWGILLDFRVSWQSKDKATAAIVTSENFDSGPQWSWGQHAIIRRDRVGVTSVGPFTGGSIIFQGYFDDPQMNAAPNSQEIVYRLHSVWWLFELNNFKQYINQFTGFSPNLTRAIGVTIANGGNGYSIGDTLTPTTGVGTQATFKVVALGVNNSVVLAIPTNGGGSYGTFPTIPTATTTSGATGGGCTLNLVLGKAPLLSKKVISEIFLGEDLHADGGFTGLWPNGNGDQIGEVVDWVNEIYNLTKRGATVGRNNALDVVQKGQIDPHTKMPITRVNSYFCSEAILNCLRWDPDTVVVEDPTTLPPTLSFRKLAKWNYATVPPTFLNYANLPEVTINITAQQERQISLQGQQSKQLAGVIIYYKTVSQIDNGIYPLTIPDVFPNDGSVTDYIPYVSSHTVELQGAKLTHVQAQVTTNTNFPLSLLLGVPAQQALWWRGHDPSLAQSAGVDPNSVTVQSVVSIVDDAGGQIDPLVFVNELTSPLPTWTGQRSIRAHISQQLKFDRYRDPANKIKDVVANARVHSKTIVLTTAQPGLFTTIGEFAQSEQIPQNVAESVYRSLAAVQFAGTITLLDKPLRQSVPVVVNGIVTNGAIAIGTRLKMIGPNTTFTNLMVQAVEQRPAYGETTVTYGPGPQVDIDLWIELARASRNRTTWELPSNRGDGGTNPSGSAINVDTGANSPSDDTSHTVGGYGHFSITGQPIP
jgi:hypothetical protein